MKLNQAWTLFLAIILLSGVPLNAFAEAIDNPCAGRAALLNLIDRPTVSDSACVVPLKKMIVEAGYQYQHLVHATGYEQNYPEIELRLGLPANNEFVVLLPNYIHQSLTPHSGYSAATLGIKHEIGYTQYWLAAIEALVTPPNGSAGFGSKGTGAAFNGIVTYSFNPQYNLSLMLGATTETQSSSNGGQRYSSINPDLVFTYAPIETLNFYGEIYGQSKTGPGKGSGFNFDGGVIYLLLANLSIDLEIGQRISGNLNGFNHYIGTGVAVII